ncbi:MAG TPA: ROK family protein [Polyangiaceae bacterium]|nr:ROK family protein [Polyangiaceae bacterium]
MSEVISLGVDMGGTKIEAAVIRRRARGEKVLKPSDAFEVLARRRIPTERDRGYDTILESTLGLIHAVAREAEVDPRAIPVGVGMPGSVSRVSGLVKNSNTACLNGRPFRQDLSQRLEHAVSFENDANCFAIAEARFGAAREHVEGVVFGVILGTGCGGGVVLRGRIWGGLQGLGGEWGHHAVGPWRRQEHFTGSSRGTGLSERPPCSCGKMGCLELYVSGGGAENEYHRRSGSSLKLGEIMQRRDRDDHARVVVDELFEAFGRGLSNVIDILDPSAVVLGGGVSNLAELYTEGRQRVAKYVFNEELLTPILKHELGDSAGVLGAALLDEMGESGA